MSRNEIWAITNYYNPCGYRRRLENFKRFKDALLAPLLVVELGFGNSFELSQGDADILLQLPGSAALWQKERLLNIGIHSLLAEVSYVAWLDSDIVLSNTSWPEMAIDALQRHCLIQLFENLIDLDPSSTHVGSEFEYTGESMAAFVQNGGPLRTPLPGSKRRYRASAKGGAWAGHRGFLERYGIYDAIITGGGDLAFAHAAYGWLNEATSSLRLNPTQATHYLNWARPFFDAVRGNVGYLKGDLFHYWHGKFADRRYGERAETLLQFDFDPYVDIAIDEYGCFKWSSDKPELHAYLRRYFATTNEDGT